MYTKNDILCSLEAMGAPRDKMVLFHSSLRSIGEVEGGAAGLLDALIEYFTSHGGLFCVPTHTWDNLGMDKPTLDMTLAESCLGAFSLFASGDTRGIKTENPTHSMMIFGDRERAIALAEGDKQVTTPTSPDSCYGKLFELGGYVLLAGVSHNKNTYLHTVEEILELPNRMDTEFMKVTVKHRDGNISTRDFRLFKCDYTEDISLRFHKYETAFRYHGAITDGYIGDAPSQLCDARKMKEVVELIIKNMNGKDPLADEEPIEPRFYCKPRKRS